MPRVLENLALLGSLYAEVCFVFAVSDTTDGTHGLLSDWLAAGRNGTVLDLGDLDAEIPIRSAHIARARNACLQGIRRSPWAAYDHLIVADLDDVLEGDLDPTLCAQAAQWLDASVAPAGVFANAAPRDYDIWALRHNTWCPGVAGIRSGTAAPGTPSRPPKSERSSPGRSRFRRNCRRSKCARPSAGWASIA